MTEPEYERDLVFRCCTNDRKAQEQLFNLYKDAMYTICYRMMKEHSLAEDTLQEAFLDIFRCLRSFQFKSTLGAWIKTIVIRTAIKHLKTNTAFEKIEDVHVEFAVQPIDSLTAYDLEKAILDLPAGYRAVFLLVEVEGYMHREVASLLGISEGTSKSQLHYAKQLLQVKLAAIR